MYCQKRINLLTQLTPSLYLSQFQLQKGMPLCKLLISSRQFGNHHRKMEDDKEKKLQAGMITNTFSFSINFFLPNLLHFIK